MTTENNVPESAENEPEEAPVPPPRGLKVAGKRLWRETVAEFSLADGTEPHKREILLQACKVADEIARLERESKSGPLTVRGSQGQSVINPLIAEARYQRGTLATLLGKLALPDSNADAIDKLRRKQKVGREAAGRRWGPRTT